MSRLAYAGRMIACNVLLAPRLRGDVRHDHMSNCVDQTDSLYFSPSHLLSSSPSPCYSLDHCTPLRDCLSRARGAGEDIDLGTWTISHRSTSLLGCNDRLD